MSTGQKTNGMTFNVVVIKYLFISVVAITVVGVLGLVIVSAVVKDTSQASGFALQIVGLVGTAITAFGMVLTFYKVISVGGNLAEVRSEVVDIKSGIVNVGNELTTVKNEINGHMTKMLEMNAKIAGDEAVTAERESVAAVAIQVKEAVATQVDNMNVETLTVEKQVKK